MSIATVKKEIRHALEKPIKTAMDAQVPAIGIVWPNSTRDRITLPEYVEVSHNFGRVVVSEIGPGAREVGRGIMTITVNTRVAEMADRNDTLAGIVAAAYPKDVPLTHAGITVHVDKVNPGGYLPDGDWFFSPVEVEWTCYRRP